MHDRHYIGGGNCAAILGISPFQTPLQAWHGIKGTLPGLDAATQAFFERRKAVEPFAAVALQQRGLTVVRQNQRYTDQDVPFFKAEIDAELSDGTNVEFKSVHPLAAKGWGHEHGGSIPAYVEAQVLWGLGVLRRRNAYAMALIGFDEDRMYPVPANDDLIGGIRDRATKWWQQYVETDTPPPVTTVDDVLQFIKPNPLLALAAEDVGLVKTIEELLDARRHVKETESHYEALLDSVKLAMKDATTLTMHGKTILTWTQNKDSIITDYKAVVNDMKPDKELLDFHTFTRPGHRVMRFKGA